MKKNKNKLFEYEKNLITVDRISNALAWDSYTSLPELASKDRISDSGFISGLYGEKIRDKEYKAFIKKAYENQSGLSQIEKAIIRERYEELRELELIPFKFQDKYDNAVASSYSAWVKAREENDYSIFKPHLKRMISLTKQRAKLLKKDVYDSVLEDYEPDFSREDIVNILQSLKENILSIIVDADDSFKGANNLFENMKFPIAEQKIVAKELLNILGIDKNRCVVGDTIHPFQITLSFNDTRIATAYRENDLLFGISSIMHEGGHCLYEQGMSEKLNYTCLQCSPSMSLHESQSRFYETVIGQSYDFWKFYLPKLKKHFPQLSSISLEELYYSVNNINASLIRISSDELTYCLHIIIRVELEMALLDGTLSVDNLPSEWNKKYKQYFGISPKKLKDGVLQDSHWADGAFGYFPSYAIGNILSSMFLFRMSGEVDFDKISKGDLIDVKKWLNKHLHVHGCIYKSKDLVQKIFKDQLNPDYYFRYLKNKYVI